MTALGRYATVSLLHDQSLLSNQKLQTAGGAFTPFSDAGLRALQVALF
jgi:hypothetical protein